MLWSRRRIIGSFGAAGAWVAAPSPARAARAPLVVWHSPEGAKGLRAQATRFTQDTGIPVVVETPDEIPGLFQQAASAGKGPDLIVAAHDRLGDWIGGALVRAVAPSRAMVADVDPLAWKGVTVQGRIWSYPLALEAITLIYNKALVTRPPANFDEVMALDARLQRDGRRAILWDYTNNYFTWPLLAAHGGYAFAQREDGSYDPRDVGVNNEGALRGAQLLWDLVRSGAMPVGSGYAEMEAAVAAGKVAMMINGPWSWVNLRRAGIDFGTARIPAVGQRPARPYVGVKGILMNRHTRQPEAAGELAERYLLSRAGLRDLNAAEPLGAPASRGYYAELAVDPRIVGIMDSARDGIPTPNNPEMGRFWATMKTSLTNLTQGRQTPREALDAAARRLKLS